MSVSFRRLRSGSPFPVRIAAVAASAMVIAPGFASVAKAGRAVIGLTTDNGLVGFNSDNPGVITGSVNVSGLDDGEMLLGIDFRPAMPSELYSLSSFGQVYRINPSSGSATKIGSAIAPADLLLQGSSFGFDFNPTVDRIRLVDDLGASARINQTNGTVVDFDPATPGIQRDGDLTYASGDVNAGLPAGVNSVAYTNNDNDPATGTELFAVDSALGVLAKIDPPNAGTLNTVGSLGQDDLPDMVAFDIADDIALAISTAEKESGSLPGLDARLFSIDLTTGAATEIGVIGDGSYSFAGGAIGGPAAIPIPPALLAAPGAALIAGWYHRRVRRAQSRM